MNDSASNLNNVIKIDNDFIGYLNWNGMETFDSFEYAFAKLMDLVKFDLNFVLKEYPKSRFSISILNRETGKTKILFQISSFRLKKLISQNLL